MNENKARNIRSEDILKGVIRKTKPLVLFLGQDYAHNNTGGSVLDKVVSHLDIKIEKDEGWLSIIKSNKLSKETFEWLSERFERTPQIDFIDNIFQLSWSAVFTTSINPQIVKKIESRGRVPESILSKDHFAKVARSRSRPPVYYLFGKCNEVDNSYSVPSNIFQLMQRKITHTSALLNRVPDTVTSLGLLVVDGFREDRDWLSVDEMLAPLSVNPEIAVLWLGNAPIGSMFYDAMIKNGQVLYDERSLSEIVLSMLLNSDSISDEQLGVIEQRGTETITLNDGSFFTVPSSLRLRVESTANIIDDSWLEQYPIVTGVELEEDFRRFHGGFGGIRNQFEGIRKGYAVKREFEKFLEKNCRDNLSNFVKSHGYIIVHGQSGTGKSVSLARVAYLLRSEFKLPILYSRNRIPSASDIEDFIAEAEKSGAFCVVLVCDANQSPDKYRDLANSLKSRGRKCLIIGSAYKIEGVKKKNTNFIEASTNTTEQEINNLYTLLERFAPRYGRATKLIHQDKNVFSLFYRHLTMGRARIIDGITDEARYTEQAIRIKARTMPHTYQPQFVLAQQLIELGIGKSTVKLFEDESEKHIEAGVDAAGKLIDLVMVAGRLDCPVPLNLLLRTLSGDKNSLDYVQIAYLFEELDLFRWDTSDAEGHEYFIHPRLRLEAELICRRRLSERSKEISYLLQLIKSVRYSSTDRRSEIVFILDMLIKMQKEGPRKNAYQDGYLDVANALTELRTTHNIIDASLMLQESVFRRSAVHVSDRKENSDIKILSIEQRDLILNEARAIVENARNQIAERTLRASKKTQQSLAVEHASIYGYLAVGLARQNAGEDVVWSHYLAAKTAITTAISVANNHYPFDIALWTPIDVLKYKEFSLAHKMELLSDVLSIFDQADTVSFNDFSASKFESRKLKAAMELGFDKIEEESYLILEKTNPTIAYYIKARSICADIFNGKYEIIPDNLMKCVSEAVSFLKSKLNIVLTDIRPLQLLIQLLWIQKTHSFIFKKEKVTIPKDNNFQDDILLLVRNLNQLAGENKRNNFRLLEAVFEWVRGSAEHSRELFRELSSDTEFEDSTRVTRRFILENNDADRGFTGRVIRDRSDGHWTVSVFDLSRNIDLLGRDFNGDDIAIGREISRFNIAFNYLGPIAEPLSRYGARS